MLPQQKERNADLAARSGLIRLLADTRPPTMACPGLGQVFETFHTFTKMSLEKEFIPYNKIKQMQR